MPSTRRRRPRPIDSPSRPHRTASGSPGRRFDVLLGGAVLAAAVVGGLTACSDDEPTPSGAATPTAGAEATATPTATQTPAATGTASERAAWAAHKSVPPGFTRIASAMLSVAIPDGFTVVNDPAKLGTTDLAASDGKGAVVAARVIPIPEGQKIPDEGPSWAAAGDVAKQAEAIQGKEIELIDADIEDQDGWRVSWLSPPKDGVPALKHVWTIVDIDDTSFAIVSVQAEPTPFQENKLAEVGDTLVIRGVTDGTQPKKTTESGG